LKYDIKKKGKVEKNWPDGRIIENSNLPPNDRTIVLNPVPKRTASGKLNEINDQG